MHVYIFFVSNIIVIFNTVPCKTDIRDNAILYYAALKPCSLNFYCRHYTHKLIQLKNLARNKNEIT